jgi:hypothetical protein
MTSDSLETILSTFPFLRAVNVSENPISDTTVLADYPKLQEVVLESMVCGLNDQNMANWLTTTPTIRRLNLSGNKVGPCTQKALGQSSSCEVLILAGCQLGDEGVERLVQGTSEIAWKEVYLPYNKIGNPGAMALAQAFSRRLPHLETLSLEYNAFDTQSLRTFVSCGLPNRLQHFPIWNHALASSSSSSTGNNPAATFPVLEQQLEHLLQINRAGKSLLFPEKHIPISLWPFIFSEANSVYGANAIYHFLKHRPDLLQAGVEAR